MIERLFNEFPYRFNKALAADLGVSWRALIRKARELCIDKQLGFLEINRKTISEMAIKAHPVQSTKGLKGWCVPGSEPFRFKKGNVSPMATDRNVVEKCRKSRNETIRMEKLRLKYGLNQKTKLNLKNIY